MNEKKLNEFLEIGAILRTKLNNCTKWVTNVVQGINNDCIEIDIGLEKDYLDNLIMIGDTLKCKYNVGDSEYNLLGWITKIDLEFPQTITIRVHQVDCFENIRDSIRHDVYLSAIIKKDKENEKGVFAVMTNVSLTGAAFIVKEDLEISFEEKDISEDDLYISVEVYISTGIQFNTKALILRKCNREKGIEYGIRFMNTSTEAQKVLNDLMNELANKDKEIYNKRSSFWSKNSKM
jgi:hypothetical protein